MPGLAAFNAFSCTRVPSLNDQSGAIPAFKARTAYGRLTALLSHGRMYAPKGECHLGRADLFAAAEGLVLAAIPPAQPEAGFATRLRADAAAVRDRLAMPLLLAASCTYQGDDQ
ncbi:PHP domain-containing protein, partial [Siccirubricoccus deserti]